MKLDDRSAVALVRARAAATDAARLGAGAGGGAEHEGRHRGEPPRPPASPRPHGLTPGSDARRVGARVLVSSPPTVVHGIDTPDPIT